MGDPLGRFAEPGIPNRGRRVVINGQEVFIQPDGSVRIGGGNVLTGELPNVANQGPAGLSPNLTVNATGEIIPVSPTSPGVDPLIGTSGDPVTVTQTADPTTVVDPTTVTDPTTAVVDPSLAPPTGLIGAESALQSGALESIDALLQSLGLSREDILAGRTGAETALERGRETVGAGTTQSIEDILAGATEGGGIVGAGTTEAIRNLLTGKTEALDFLGQGRGGIQGQLGAGISELRGAGTEAVGAVRGAGGTAQNLLDRGVGALEAGKTEGLDLLNNLFDQAVDPLTGFIDPGRQAQILQASLTGALGPDAQRAALENFATDPGTKFAVAEAERALLRNAAAVGGLGGGNVRKALVRQAVGEAQKAFNTRVDQLSRIALTGLQAGQTAGQLRGQQATSGAQLIGRTAEGVAGLRQTGAGIAERLGVTEADILTGTARDIAGLRETGALAELDLANLASTVSQRTGESLADAISTGSINQADIVTSAAKSIADLTADGAFTQADVDVKRAELERSTGISLGALEERTGVNIGSILENLGSSSADLRSQAGRDLAAAIADASGSLADLQTAQGTGVSDVVSGTISNIANLFLQEGLSDSASSQQFASFLANLAVGEGSTAANISANIAEIEAAGILGTNTAVQTGISGLIELLGQKETEGE